MNVFAGTVAWFGQFANNPWNGGTPATIAGAMVAVYAIGTMFYSSRRSGAALLLFGLVTTVCGSAVELELDWVSRYAVFGIGLVALILLLVPMFTKTVHARILTTISLIALTSALAQIGANNWPNAGWEMVVATMWLALAIAIPLGVIKLLMMAISGWYTRRKAARTAA